MQITVTKQPLVRKKKATKKKAAAKAALPPMEVDSFSILEAGVYVAAADAVKVMRSMLRAKTPERRRAILTEFSAALGK